MNSQQVLSKEFELLKQDLIDAYDSKGMRASGEFAEGLEVDAEINRGVLWGYEYSQQLETGRQAGKQPPSDVIEQWIEDKGIASQIEGNIKISSLAYLIARKIGREGWYREDYGGVELISQIVTEQRLQKILDEVGDARLIEYSTEIITLIKELAA
mgnify:CR=1 FL=1